MNCSGEYICNMTVEAECRSFRPPMPQESALEMDEEFLRLLVETNRHLAQLNTAAQLIPKPSHHRAKTTSGQYLTIWSNIPSSILNAPPHRASAITPPLSKKLQELGALIEVSNTARNRIFAYQDYLHILCQGTYLN